MKVCGPINGIDAPFLAEKICWRTSKITAGWAEISLEKAGLKIKE